MASRASATSPARVFSVGPVGSLRLWAAAWNGSRRLTKSSSIMSTASATKPGLTALTTAKAPLMARPVRPPLESTSSSINFTQSATTALRLPGTSKTSLRVLMAGNLHQSRWAWYSSRGMGRFHSAGGALAVLPGLNLLNYIHRYVPAPVLPAIIRDLHIKDSQAGFVQMLFIVT